MEKPKIILPNQSNSPLEPEVESLDLCQLFKIRFKESDGKIGKEVVVGHFVSSNEFYIFEEDLSVKEKLPEDKINAINNFIEAQMRKQQILMAGGNVPRV
jgi:hypothetical protein